MEELDCGCVVSDKGWIVSCDASRVHDSDEPIPLSDHLSDSLTKEIERHQRAWDKYKESSVVT
jgi:hypothetical protein